MGDRSYSARASSGLRLLSRLVSVALALFVLCVSGRASAAGNPAVPMCGEHNESVVAPPIFRVADDGSIRATPCQTPDGFGVSQNAPAPPERTVVYERSERVLGFGALLVTQSPSALLSIAGASQALERPGFVGTLFRPPRA